MLRIVTDGAADMPPNWADKYEINIVPINIHFLEKAYHQIAEFGDTILSMHVTSKLSGTFESAKLAARICGTSSISTLLIQPQGQLHWGLCAIKLGS